MNEALVSKTGVPSWYYIKYDNKIIAGLGVIKNDFHKRHDLTPNICAVYVNEGYRMHGIAKELLNYTCNELRKKKIENVYLITTHKDFYERCGFNYYSDIEENDGKIVRCYQKNYKKDNIF